MRLAIALLSLIFFHFSFTFVESRKTPGILEHSEQRPSTTSYNDGDTSVTLKKKFEKNDFESSEFEPRPNLFFYNNKVYPKGDKEFEARPSLFLYNNKVDSKGAREFEAGPSFNIYNNKVDPKDVNNEFEPRPNLPFFYGDQGVQVNNKFEPRPNFPIYGDQGVQVA